MGTEVPSNSAHNKQSRWLDFRGALQAIAAGIISVWVWGKPWLQKNIQKNYGRKKWTFTYPTVAASLLTLIILAIPTFYKSPTRVQIDIQESYMLEGGPDSKVLFLLAIVHNMGEAPIVPENFKVHVLEGSNSLGTFDSLPFVGGWFILYPSDVPGDKTFAIEGHEFLERRLMEKPVTQGMPVNGWMVFDLSGVRNWRNYRFSLEFHDSFGKKGGLELGMPIKIPPFPDEIKGHRGVTYPFKEKRGLPKQERPPVVIDGDLKKIINFFSSLVSEVLAEP